MGNISVNPLFYYGDSLLPYLLELILLEEEDPTELGLPSDLLRLHHHQLTNERWQKIRLQSGLITCLPIEKIIAPAISSLATTVDCKTAGFFSFSKSVLQGAKCRPGHAWQMFD